MFPGRQHGCDQMHMAGVQLNLLSIMLVLLATVRPLVHTHHGATKNPLCIILSLEIWGIIGPFWAGFMIGKLVPVNESRPSLKFGLMNSHRERGVAAATKS